MKIKYTIILILLAFASNAQNFVWTKVCDLKSNTTSDEWRWIKVDTVKKIDTTSVSIDSTIKDNYGKIIGWKSKDAVFLIKEPTQPKKKEIHYNTLIGFDTLWGFTHNTIYKKKKPVKRKKHYYKTVTTYKTVPARKSILYFKGYGEVYEGVADTYMILLKNPKGTYYKKK